MNDRSQLKGNDICCYTKYDEKTFEMMLFFIDDRIRKMVVFKKGYYFRKVKSDKSDGVYILNGKIYYKREDQITFPDSIGDFFWEINEFHSAYIRNRKLKKLLKSELQ